MRYALIFALLAATTPALAGQAPKTAVTHFPSSHSAMLSGAALNAAAASRTVTLNVGSNWAKLRLGVAFTWAAASTLTAQFTCQYASGSTYYRRLTQSCTSGACSVYTQTQTYTTGGASISAEFEYDVRGCVNVKVLLGGASGGASDLVTTEANVVVGD